MPKARGLGKGLDALIPPITVSGEEVRQISLEAIKPNPRQARREWDEEELRSLATSIAEYGLLHPVVVRPLGEGYELVAGERRWRACRLLGWETIPALVRSYDDLSTACALLVENLHRQELNPLEEADAYRRLIEEFGLTQEEVARRVGKSRVAVTNTLRLLNLPPRVLQFLRQGQLTAGHARALLALPEVEQELFATRAVQRGMSVRALEQAIRRRLRPSDPAPEGRGSGEGFTRNLAVKHKPVSDDLARGLIMGLLLGGGHFGGDGRQAQVTLRMHGKHELLFRWLVEQVPGSRLYGPYSHAGRFYYQWMVRGKDLQALLERLDMELWSALDPPSYQQLCAMREKYRV
ncbi:ParB/RepB/Spo0J family partition protein [Desulfothermobacter acidiphilus]|uniref:ParB/RepB/Spo0J family partition protein n=1 Tax=Desulfothermobacter acidiphilus TaxID=1938353 RepID=UPI003F8A6448